MNLSKSQSSDDHDYDEPEEVRLIADDEDYLLEDEDDGCICFDNPPNPDHMFTITTRYIHCRLVKNQINRHFK